MQQNNGHAFSFGRGAGVRVAAIHGIRDPRRSSVLQEVQKTVIRGREKALRNSVHCLCFPCVFAILFMKAYTRVYDGLDVLYEYNGEIGNFGVSGDLFMKKDLLDKYQYRNWIRRWNGWNRNFK